MPTALPQHLSGTALQQHLLLLHDMVHTRTACFDAAAVTCPSSSSNSTLMLTFYWAAKCRVFIHLHQLHSLDVCSHGWQLSLLPAAEDVGWHGSMKLQHKPQQVQPDNGLQYAEAPCY